jgi:hypothetical protein
VIEVLPDQGRGCWLAEEQVADVARADPLQRQDAANDARQPGGFVTIDKPETDKAAVVEESADAGAALVKESKLRDIGYPLVKAVVDCGDERRDRRDVVEPREKPDRPALLGVERAGFAEPIEAALQRREARRRRPGDGDCLAAPGLPVLNEPRLRPVGVPFSLLELQLEGRQAEKAAMAFNPPDELGIGAWRGGEGSDQSIPTSRR